MLIKLGKIVFTMRYRLPYKQFIVVSSRCNLIFIMHAPFKSTDFLLMTKKPLLIIFMSSNVSHKYWSISTSSCNQWAVPWACTDPISVPSERPHFLSLVYVPNRYLSIFISHTEMLASLWPCYWCNLVVNAIKLAELTDTWIKSVPNVDTLTKGNCQHILLWPVH